jgi:hypothetical protein
MGAENDMVRGRKYVVVPDTVFGPYVDISKI